MRETNTAVRSLHVAARRLHRCKIVTTFASARAINRIEIKPRAGTCHAYELERTRLASR